MAVWDKYGLAVSGFIASRASDPRYSSLPRATRFRLALEEQDGLFSLFGQFLSGRADLLSSPHLIQLRKIRTKQKPSCGSAIERDMSGRVAGLKAMRVAPGAEIYSGIHEGRPVVVEFSSGAPDPSDRGDWKPFLRELKTLDDAPEFRICHHDVVDQFHEWLKLAANIGRKRSILSNLEAIPAGCVTRFPSLFPDLQTDNCLVYAGIDAESSILEIQPDTPLVERNLQLLAEGLLELSLLISVVDAEMRLDSFAAVNGALRFRCLPVLAPVPVEWHYELLQYMASTIAGQSPRALHMLSRICCPQDSYAGEQQLMRELSGLQPELKINLVTPETVSALENYWKTLAKTGLRAPLFLELFHRQWTLLGQYNGEVAPSVDVIADSLWPILGRILRLRFGELLSVDKGRDWAASSGLMLLTAARQVGMLLEQVRDNDLAVTMDRQEYESSDAQLNLRTGSLIRSTLALGVFLLAIYCSFKVTGGTARFITGSAAAISAVLLALFAARIE